MYTNDCGFSATPNKVIQWPGYHIFGVYNFPDYKLFWLKCALAKGNGQPQMQPNKGYIDLTTPDFLSRLLKKYSQSNNLNEISHFIYNPGIM